MGGWHTDSWPYRLGAGVCWTLLRISWSVLVFPFCFFVRLPFQFSSFCRDLHVGYHCGRIGDLCFLLLITFLPAPLSPRVVTTTSATVYCFYRVAALILVHSTSDIATPIVAPTIANLNWGSWYASVRIWSKALSKGKPLKWRTYGYSILGHKMAHFSAGSNLAIIFLLN